DDIAIDIGVAGPGLAGGLGDGFVDAAVQAESQPVAQAVDVLDQRVGILALVANQMQHGAEYLVFKSKYGWNFDQGGGDESTVEPIQFVLVVRLENGASLGFELFDVAHDARFGVAVDDRPDVGRQQDGFADGLLGHRAFQHPQHGFGNVVLQAEHAQGRAALARAVECRRHYVADNLLGQGR